MIRIFDNRKVTGGIVPWVLILAFQITLAQPEYKKAEIGDVSLHYQTSGEGFPLILIHGSLTDLRYWEKQIPELSKAFRVITYSRRYNFPNTNEPQSEHSALIEAQDFLGFMDHLQIDRAHILGHSYGAYTALAFAADHPEKVNKLILAEPPLMRWLPEITGGEGIYEKFMQDVWDPMKAAYKESDATGLEFTSQWYYNTSFKNISAEWQKFLKDNIPEWKALLFSSDAYPYIEPENLKNFNFPVLLLSGEKNKGNFFELIENRLNVLLPNSYRVIIENAGHEMFLDNPEATNSAILRFLEN